MIHNSKNLIKIAIGQIGYKEKISCNNLDSNTANAGSGNHTKYARDLHNAGYYGGADKCGYAWCDVFVDWCFFTLCGNSKEAQKMTCQTGPYGAGCSCSAQYYKNAGRLYYSNPKPGDQIFFGNSSINHTGIVETVGNGYITTIEGNTSDMVARRRYNISNSYIKCFGRPIYSDNVNTENSIESGTNNNSMNNNTNNESNIPVLNGNKYTVKYGDSWWGISNKFLGSGDLMHRLAEYNGKSINYILQPGDILNIPDTKDLNNDKNSITNDKNSITNDKNSINNYTNYTVKLGDTWWGIAERFMGSGLKMEELAEFNKTTIQKMLYPYDIIKIPN